MATNPMHHCYETIKKTKIVASIKFDTIEARELFKNNIAIFNTAGYGIQILLDSWDFEINVTLEGALVFQNSGLDIEFKMTPAVFLQVNEQCFTAGQQNPQAPIERPDFVNEVVFNNPVFNDGYYQVFENDIEVIDENIEEYPIPDWYWDPTEANDD